MKHLSEINVVKVKILSNQPIKLNTNNRNNEIFNIEDFVDFFNFDTSYNLFSEELILELNSIIREKNNASLNDLKKLSAINQKEWKLILENIPEKMGHENERCFSFYNGSTAIYFLLKNATPLQQS